MNRLFVILALVCVIGPTQKERSAWWSIEPLVTTRAEVDALLGQPTSRRGYMLSYDTNDEHVTIWFGGGKTNKADSCNWKVGRSTVFVYVVAPKRRLPISDAGFDLTKFKKDNDPESEEAFYYYNEVDGTTISTRMRNGQEVVESIHRNPKLTERQKYCPASNSKKPGD